MWIFKIWMSSLFYTCMKNEIEPKSADTKQAETVPALTDSLEPLTQSARLGELEDQIGTCGQSHGQSLLAPPLSEKIKNSPVGEDFKDTQNNDAPEVNTWSGSKAVQFWDDSPVGSGTATVIIDHMHGEGYDDEPFIGVKMIWEGENEQPEE
jgi:hypothetical protein